VHFNLLGFSTQTLGCIIPVTELATLLGNTILYYLVWVVSLLIWAFLFGFFVFPVSLTYLQCGQKV